MEHHRLSMSNWARWELCPCAVSTHRGGEAADSGTRSHAYLSWLIGGGEGDPGVAGLTSDERGRAEWAFDRIVDAADGAEIHSEARVEIRPGMGCVDGTRLAGIYGVCDAWFSRGGVLHVFDYKTYATGEADYSAQTGGYALALATSRPSGEWSGGFALFTLNGGSRTVDRTDCASVDLLAVRARAVVDVHVERGDDLSNARCNAFCRHCGRAGACPAADRALAVVNGGSVFDRMSLAKRMVVVREVRAICERVEREARDELDGLVDAAGGDVTAATLTDGEVAWQYRERAGAAVLSDIAGLAEAVRERGVSPADLMAVCKVSRSAVCDRLVAANPDMKAAEARRVVAPFYRQGRPARVLERVR